MQVLRPAAPYTQLSWLLAAKMEERPALYAFPAASTAGQADVVVRQPVGAMATHDDLSAVGTNPAGQAWHGRMPLTTANVPATHAWQSPLTSPLASGQVAQALFKSAGQPFRKPLRVDRRPVTSYTQACTP